MIQQAKARAASSGTTNVEFQLDDVETVTLPDHTFDFILCSNGMAYLQDIPAALKRFHGWLKPGGKLCFNNPLAPMMPLTETLISICMEKFGVAPEDAAVVLGNEDNIRAALTSTGFQDIQVTGTEEVKVSPDTTPGQFAENIFNMMERFPAAPLSQLLTQQQVEELRADYMVMAVPQAEALPQQDGGIVNQYVMLWAVATA
ncbi:probable aklanonic acid methyltransferase DnrC at N-terminal half [Coccomyxa sp. Obi]|nr:probable aklanonic acid methyltransferase DnrC at N-terminal half [Coccomyxa sp. Obi]